MSNMPFMWFKKIRQDKIEQDYCQVRQVRKGTRAMTVHVDDSTVLQDYAVGNLH